MKLRTYTGELVKVIGTLNVIVKYEKQRIKKSGSISLTKGFVLQPKINLIWPFLNNGGGSLKMLKGLSKFLEREI